MKNWPFYTSDCLYDRFDCTCIKKSGHMENMNNSTVLLRIRFISGYSLKGRDILARQAAPTKILVFCQIGFAPEVKSFLLQQTQFQKQLGILESKNGT